VELLWDLTSDVDPDTEVDEAASAAGPPFEPAGADARGANVPGVDSDTPEAFEGDSLSDEHAPLEPGASLGAETAPSMATESDAAASAPVPPLDPGAATASDHDATVIDEAGVPLLSTPRPRDPPGYPI
jgi:hypothetical protein